MPENTPRLLFPAVRRDSVVTTGCGDACPNLPAKHRIDCDLPDPEHLSDDGFRAGRDRIERLVQDLTNAATEPPKEPGQ